LRRWARVVGKLAVASRVGTVEVQVCSEGSTRAITLRASSFVIARVRHVRNLRRDGVHPLAPDIFVSLVENARITTEWSAKVWDLASRDRDLVVWILIARRQVAAGAIVTLVDALDTALISG